MDEAGLVALKVAIRDKQACDAQWVEAVQVREPPIGAAEWEGQVQVFDLMGHPKATRAYAWSQLAGTHRRFYVILHSPVVDCPAAAVRAALAGDKRTWLG